MTGKRSHAVLRLIAALLITLAMQATAAEPAAHIAGDVPNARLAGQGSFRWFGLRIYDAQLWVGEQGFRPDAPGAAPFALDLRYARALVGAKIAAASDDEIEKLGFGTPQKRAAWRAQMEQIFPDVEDGTRITGVYLPDAGARFYRDGKPIGGIPDTEFARAFFAIWLDSRTTAASLRSALLTDAAPR